MVEALVILLACMPSDGLEIEFVKPQPVDGRIYPTAGSDVGILILKDGYPAGGALLEAVYLPGSSVEETVEIGRTREDGTIEWVPAKPGLVTLEATLERRGEETEVITATASRTVSIRFERFPWEGILVMLLAGGFLFGGMILSYRMLTS